MLIGGEVCVKALLLAGFEADEGRALGLEDGRIKNLHDHVHRRVDRSKIIIEAHIGDHGSSLVSKFARA
jgi:hypothetical protein